MRFGTIFTFTLHNIEDTKNIIDRDPYTTIIEFPNSEETDIYADWYSLEQNSSIVQKTRTQTSSTVFTYGIGYNPFDYLQIDLLGIGSDDFEFDGVRLSFTMKF